MSTSSLGLRYRTAKHLTMKQWAWRIYCRGQFALMERWPTAALERFQKAKLSIARPDGMSPGLAAAARHVIQLQSVVHGEYLDGIPHGGFTLLNRRVDFGSLAQVEWRRELGEKNNRLWRMNLAYMGYLVPLFAADVHSGLEIARSLLESMHGQNPWSARGIFRDVWHPYTVSHRIINLLTCLHLAAQAGIAEDSSLLAPILDEIRLGGAFVSANLERDLQYNHLFKNYVSLAMLTAATGQSKLPRNISRAISDLVRQQFLADGGPAERCPMYHNLALLDLRILCESRVMPADLLQHVSQVAEEGEIAAAALMHPDGNVALFNDSWLVEAPKTSDMARMPAILAPELPLKAELPSTGYVRLAYRQHSAIMDFGACGPDDNPGHAHADFLSFELSVHGVRSIVDPGVPTYSAGEDRDRSRSAHSHNGPVLEGLEPIEFWDSFRVGRRGYAHKLMLHGFDKDSSSFAAWHDGYLHEGAAVGRAIRLVPETGLFITDLWIGQLARAAHSHFLVSNRWTPVEGSIFRGKDTASKQELEFEPVTGKISGLEPSPYCERFGVRESGTRVSLIPELLDGIRIMSCWIRWGDASHSYRAECEHLRKEFLSAMLALPNTKMCRN